MEYWKGHSTKQQLEGWGKKVIESLGDDLQKFFPGIKGFSRANIFYMRSFYLANEKVQQLVGQLTNVPFFQIPWGHNILLITKLKDNDERLWYAKKVIEEGLSRGALGDWIASNAYKRHSKVSSNFLAQLPDPQSRLAREILKDPYNFDFLTMSAGYLEQDLEQGLVKHIQQLMLELGKGFAFIGRQYHLEIAGDDYYLDLLFYHIRLRCFFVIELKNTDFKPEYVRKMSFYLSAVDDQLKHETDNPSIGIILCKTKNDLKVEYTLRDTSKPMGVAEYVVKALDSLPKALKGELPTKDQIEVELA